MSSISSTKIVATIGPASETEVQIRKLIQAGVNVFRFNLKHNTHLWHATRINRVRKVSLDINLPIGILMDLQGPEIRIGNFTEGQIEIKKGEEIVFRQEFNGGESQEIVLNNLALLVSLEKGHELSIDDGKFRFRVLGKTEDGGVRAQVLEGGVLKSRKGVNVPNIELDLPTLVEKDFEDLSLASKEDVDFVALSFVRSAKDILTLKEELNKRGVKAKVVAKIETALALKNFEEILRVTDCVMVARGDMGVELPIEQVPFYQKSIIKRCLEVGRPVITATQMLESMIENPSPTRAEVSDVANAIYDFTDAIMLSGETAAGKYPEKAVMMMKRIATFTEEKRPSPEKVNYELGKRSEAVTFSAFSLSKSEYCAKEGIKAFVVMTESGDTAINLSRLRPGLPIIALTPYTKVRDQMLMVWGVVPVFFALKKDKNFNESDKVKEMFKAVIATGIVGRGDKVIMVYGEDWDKQEKTSVVRIQEIG